MTIDQDDTQRRREVIVVLGVGRSGTSLTMQALKSLGVGMSDNMIAPNVSNPNGFNEDADIVDIHKKLLSEVSISPTMPLKNGWLDMPIVKQSLKKLRDIVETQLDKNNGLWSFKDPRTVTVLPLWVRLFNQNKIVPKFVLAVRKPEALIDSFKQNYGTEQETTELIIQQRTLDAIYYTRGNLTVIDYDDWFSQPELNFKKLSDLVFRDYHHSKILNELPEIKLNRSVNSYVKIKSQLVKEMHEKLILFSSGDLSVKILMDYVIKSRQLVDVFKPWMVFIEKAQTSNSKMISEKNSLFYENQKMADKVKELSRIETAYTELENGVISLEYINKLMVD